MRTSTELLKEVQRALNSIPRADYDDTDTYKLVSEIGVYLRATGCNEHFLSCDDDGFCNACGEQ
jgi:hypothetical protein